MSDSFFDSEIVQHSLEDIALLQSEVLMFAQYGLYATIEEQRANVEVLRTLLAKQKNMFFRCMLSDSDSAKELAQEIVDHFAKYGMVEDADNPIELFDLMSISIDEIEKEIDQYDPKDSDS